MKGVIESVVLRIEPTDHPFCATREVRNTLLVVVTADRGLCGAFNLNINLKAENSLREENASLYSIGKRGRDYFLRRGADIVREWIEIRKVEYEMAQEIAKELTNYYETEEFDRICLVYTKFHSVLRQEVILEDLLPIKPEGKRLFVEYLFEPLKRELLEGLLSRYIESKIFAALLESETSEHAARMNAMDLATKNCGEMIKDLTLFYNKTRQAAITKEMLDIIGGAEALK